MTFKIRVEEPSDRGAIRLLTETAFREMPYAGGDEQDVIDRLRARNNLHLSLVAVRSREVVGQITFSHAKAPDSSGSWFSLGPVSVLPEHQGLGIGSALIEKGIEMIRSQGAQGCILTGNPLFYRRFGFVPAPENAPTNEPAEFFMIRVFGKDVPRGRFHFHNAFYGNG